MSRSHKKTPCGGNAGGSDKYSKRIANRNLRRENKALLNKKVEDFEPLFIEEVRNGNAWEFQKDGRNYYGIEGTYHFLRKVDGEWEWHNFWTKEDIKKAMRK